MDSAPDSAQQHQDTPKDPLSGETAPESTLWTATVRFGRIVGKHWWSVLLVVVLGLLLLAGGTYLCWYVGLPQVIAWGNEKAWHWILAWYGVMVLASVPVFVLLGFGAVIAGAMGLFDEPGRTEEVRKALDEIDDVEKRIRGSSDPVDYARYGRKSLRLYYHLGQSQVRISFYIGVLAMIFGFMFLLAGLLLQALDTSQIPYLRRNPDIALVTVGGGVIIEFIAATFLWIYRATIEQQTLYYRRQMLVHSALISVAITSKMQGESAPALGRIVDAMISPDWETHFPELPKVRSTAAPKTKPVGAARSKARGDGAKGNGRRKAAVVS